MKCIATRAATAVLGWAMAAGCVMAQGYGSPTLLPLPPESATQGYRPTQSYGAPAQYQTAQHEIYTNNTDESNTAPEPVPAPQPFNLNDDSSSNSPSDVFSNWIAKAA